jgi:hypothetical protein
MTVQRKEKNVERAIQDFATLLTNAATSLGFEAARLWPQVVMITFVKSVWSIVIFNVMLIPAIAFPIRVWRWFRAQPDTWEHSDDVGWFIGAVGASVIFLGVYLASMPEALVGVVSPEAKTVMDIVHSAKR